MSRSRGPSPFEEVGRRLLVALAFRSEHVTTSVGRVHVWHAEGSGPLPPLLLFHGLASSAMHWMPLLWQLRREVQGLFAIDLPAHGFSDRPEVLTEAILRTGVLEALDRVHDRPSVVIGNSLGGAAAVKYLNARPDRVLGALLFSPAGAPLDADELAAIREWFRVDRHTDAVRFVRALHGRPVGMPAHLLAPMLRRSLGDPLLRSWLQAISDTDFLEPGELGAIGCPVRVVWGRQERILPQRSREFWRAHLPPHGEIVEPEGFGHSPVLDDRRWTLAQIREFARIAETGSRGGEANGA